jgi:ABC-2 type transport system ATP-binding protein
MPPILELREVRKNYGHTPALRGVSFTVETGELFGLLGPNGAGKTTLLSILAGLHPADSGDVLIDGQPLQFDSRRKIGIATQDLAIYPELTARENLLFFGKLYGLAGSDLNTRANEMLAAVELTDRAEHRAGTFSGGMKRRLNLAVALIHRPQLLLLDEPTTGVDPQSRNHIFEQVKAQNAARLTVIYTSHYMEEVQALCPRIAIVDHGTVKACDTRTNLLRKLDARATLTLREVPLGLVERLRMLPGVKTANIQGSVVTLTASDLPPILAKVVAACGDIESMEVEQPSLERVFLDLTGSALRD